MAIQDFSTSVVIFPYMEESVLICYNAQDNGETKLISSFPGSIEKVFDSNMKINGVKLNFLNDLDIDEEGNMYVSETSVKWTRRESPIIMMEGRPSGR